MTDYARLLRALASAGVEFIVVGGAAATAHGAARLTLDLDVVYRRTPDNLERVVACLSGLDPYLRGAPPGLPDSDAIVVFGVECRCLGLDRLIQVKRAAGRPKDLEAIAELESLRDEIRFRHGER
jgi:predicted nucleotidyltransferase